ncbi:MAG: thioesterase family protein [Pseudomonadota bacterium]|nr:thioesterase family protein [Pseudomonadota bacterium]
MAETQGQTRADFPFFMDIPTRWMDNDAYGHVNNVQYYSFFDTVVNAHLVRFGGLDANTSPVIGLVVESRCQFKKSLYFPGTVNCGLRCVKIGRTSVTYEIGLFREGDAEIAALGHFVHVYVERASQTPTPIPAERRAAMERIQVFPGD